MFEGQEGPALESGAPGHIGRKHSRSAAEATALPAAGPVARVRPRMSGWSRPRKALAIGSVVGGIGLIAFGMATSSTQDLSALANIPVTTYADRIDSSGSAGSVPVGEYGVVDQGITEQQRTPAKEDDGSKRDTDTSESTRADDQAGSDPAPPATGTDQPTTPTTPTGPTTPVPPTTPPTTPPTDTTPPTTPVVPKPLAFAGAEKSYLLNVLGIKVLGSYTLTVTGNPGSTASVTYGSRNAGTITFGADGRGSLSVGGALLDLGLSNPTIRVAYSDGTAGTAIEAARDSL